MKQCTFKSCAKGSVNWNRTLASSMVLAVLMLVSMAAKHEAEAREHEALAVQYTRNPRLAASKHTMAPNTAEHFKYFAEHCRNAAKEMKAMASAHEDMAMK